MSFATWIGFVIAGTLIAISPGSGAILSMSHGLAYGVRRASATVLGLQLGLVLVLVIAGAGVGSLLLASEFAFTVV
jgi:homoserine/homoserine lactone efflux protein